MRRPPPPRRPTARKATRSWPEQDPAGRGDHPSGLQYQVIRPGSERPLPSSKVRVNYEGKLLNGTVFDSSYGRQPAEFGLDQVIRAGPKASR